MNITRKEFEKISNLSMIRISDSEINEFNSQLDDILNYVKKVQQYKFINQDFQSKDKETKLREDIMINSEANGLVEQFSDRENSLLKVKKVL